MSEFGSTADPNMNHEDQVYSDQLDCLARIYVALSDGKVVATATTLYDSDFDFVAGLPEFYNILQLDNFISGNIGSVALSSKFTISSDQRGSLAAHLITSKIYQDTLDDGIDFLFSTCPPSRIDFYSKLGFHVYSQPLITKGGLLAPIVLVTKDWRHLEKVKSPLIKKINKQEIQGEEDCSVKWFYQNYGKRLDKFVSGCSKQVLDNLLKHEGKESWGVEKQSRRIFDGLSPNDIEQLLCSCKLMHFLPGDVIGHSADKVAGFFIVGDGEVVASTDGANGEQHIIGVGEAFGEVAMLTKSKLHRNFKALSATILVVVGRHDLQRMMKSTPRSASRILYNLTLSLSDQIVQTRSFNCTVTN